VSGESGPGAVEILFRIALTIAAIIVILLLFGVI
jgi:hypothetical protein